MVLSIHQPQYLPWLGFFDKIAKSDLFVFLDQVQYKTREFQNRNKIRTKEGWVWLTVPVVSKNKGRQPIKDVEINNEIPWGRHHLNSLKSCYGRAEFFDSYFSFFENVYAKKWERLVGLNIDVINFILGQFGINTNVKLESDIGTAEKGTDRIIEICKKTECDTYLSGIGGRDYLEEEKFVQSGIKLIYQDFTHPVYKQQFVSGEEGFLPYMSAVDLLFNEGSKSREILRLTRTT